MGGGSPLLFPLPAPTMPESARGSCFQVTLVGAWHWFWASWPLSGHRVGWEYRRGQRAVSPPAGSLLGDFVESHHFPLIYFPFHARHFSPGLTGNNSLLLPSPLFCWRALKGSKSMPISQVLEGSCRSQKGEWDQNLPCRQRWPLCQRTPVQVDLLSACMPGHTRCMQMHTLHQLQMHPNEATCGKTLVCMQALKITGVALCL